ncbi:MAG TPA: tRNA (adenosine(37)-N6)-threonylcarbamoyltransferase complex dimerization subunit type 1 TsaB [Candidatus Binatia bacterium]|nr:tRNA (adenosine(37)-N6)-threonylcarbamoyltransferase complex dimerization subunit type 1 TsaB [Candidatus Binatia bacterium]
MAIADGWLLALDTATATIVVAAGAADGTLLDEEAFEGRYRHSQELLPAVLRLMERAGLRLPDLRGIVVGTGPGAFTGLRVGLATAKTLAHELSRPIVGLPTGEALLAAAGARELWLPSGPRDLVVVRRGAAPRVVRERGDATGEGDAGAGDMAGVVPDSENTIAVDLAGRAPTGALERGRTAVEALGASLLRLGAERLGRGDADDPERLVPSYARPPRGAIGDDAEMDVAWSRDPR